MTSGRTLDFRGVKTVLSLAQRVNATTHSYTLQPVVSADGNLTNRMLIVFQERKAPQKFQDELAPFRNLYCRHSTSGLATTDIENDYVENILAPLMPENSVLLLDSWSGYNESKEFPILAAKKIKVLVGS